VCVCFFFSSRRRHTRFSRDWSSDVCSSDLCLATQEEVARPLGRAVPGRLEDGPRDNSGLARIAETASVYRSRQRLDVRIECKDWIERFQALRRCEQLTRRTGVTPERIARTGSQPRDLRLLELGQWQTMRAVDELQGRSRRTCIVLCSRGSKKSPGALERCGGQRRRALEERSGRGCAPARSRTGCRPLE